ncbi:MAG: folylpolyglutamate synthase/dihydrofolate synthase family protein [Pseudomonadota bacterium]
MNFSETLAYLDRLQETRMRLDLGPSLRLLELLGHPDRRLRSTIVAGTNGKGSVCACLTAIAKNAGLCVGTYTSPHLESVVERVAIDGVPLDPERFARMATHVRNVVEANQFPNVTYFEFVTMVAVLAFLESRCDLSIFEVGLGGRLDTTNILERIGVAITRIDFDHMKVLGDTLEKIAGEKGAVMRRGCFAVIASQGTEARARLLEMAEEAGVEPRLGSRDFAVEGSSQAFTYRQGGNIRGPYRLALRGDHQVENAGVALATVEELNRSGFSIPETAVREGFARVVHPGRLELFRDDAGREVWLDVAHNRGGAEALVRYVSSNIAGPLDLLVGILADKEWRKILDGLLTIADSVTICRPNSPRAWKPDEATNHIAGRGVAVTRADAPVDALDTLLRRSRRILCTGSFYVVGAVRRKLIEMKFKPD